MTDPFRFGDDEPEDVWDREDAIKELVDNLSRRLDLLGESRTAPDGAPLEDLIEDLRHRLGRARANLTDDLKQRFDMVRDDLEFLLGRAEQEGVYG